jgi:hypothetical protein
MNARYAPLGSLLLALGLLGLAGCGQAPSTQSSPWAAWNQENKPINFRPGYRYKLEELPLSGNLTSTPWTDSYWPSDHGGIAYRWLRNEKGFDYNLLSQAALRTMTPKDLATLSPAEKYDIFRGRYDFPTVLEERDRTSAKSHYWEGLCHGWAAAALNYAEPQSVLMRNRDGILIPFGATDVKALLSYAEGELSTGTEVYLGERCDATFKRHPWARRRSECKDVNAGAFHVVLANEIGRLKRGFIADVTRDAEVWNHPVYAYSSMIVSQRLPSGGEALGTVVVKTLRTEMSYRLENQQDWNKVGADDFSFTIEYRYRLEINIHGEIIGGSWISGDHPDFLWAKELDPRRNLVDDVDTILRASLKSRGITHLAR